MPIEKILSYLGTLGIGGILGIILKYIFDYNINKRKLLFEARTKAYAGITGRLFNLFLEPDITMLKNEALIFAKINALLSEACLLGSPRLVDLLGEFKEKVNEFHTVLDKKDDEKSKKLHPELVKLVSKVTAQMREDLFITSKSVWSWRRVKEK